MRSALVVIIINRFRKAFYFFSGYFKALLILELLSSTTRSTCCKRGLAGWMRPAIEHAQDVVNWWVRPVVGVLFYFNFEQSHFLCTTFFYQLIFSFALSLCLFSKTSCCNLCGSFGVFVFQVVLIKF